MPSSCRPASADADHRRAWEIFWTARVHELRPLPTEPLCDFRDFWGVGDDSFRVAIFSCTSVELRLLCVRNQAVRSKSPLPVLTSGCRPCDSGLRAVAAAENAASDGRAEVLLPARLRLILLERLLRLLERPPETLP